MANGFFPFSIGPNGHRTVVDASGFLIVTANQSGPYRVFGRGTHGHPLIVDASGRLVISPLSAGFGGNNSIVELTAADSVIDLSVNRNFHILLDDDMTILVQNPMAGAKYVFVFEQDGDGGHTVSWSGGILWRGQSPPTVTADPNAIDVVSAYYDSVLGTLLGDISADFG